MRTGVSFIVSPTDRHRLRALVKDRNAPPHILGAIREYPGKEVLNAYDSKYAELLATLK